MCRHVWVGFGKIDPIVRDDPFYLSFSLRTDGFNQKRE
jgi:hypothetical protein